MFFTVYFEDFESRENSVYSSRTNMSSTGRTEEDCIFEEFSFFLHKTDGALMMLIRYDDFDADFDDLDCDDDHKRSRGALRV